MNEALTPRRRLAEDLDSVLPRMAFQQYGEFYTQDPEWDIHDYYDRVADELISKGWTLDAARAQPSPDLATLLKDDVRALAHLTREDWAKRRGGDPIARTINAVFDIIDARLATPASPGDERLREARMDALRGWHLAYSMLTGAHNHPVEDCDDARFVRAALATPAAPSEAAARLHRHKCGDCGKWLADLDEAVPTLLADLDTCREEVRAAALPGDEGLDPIRLKEAMLRAGPIGGVHPIDFQQAFAVVSLSQQQLAMEFAESLAREYAALAAEEAGR